MVPASSVQILLPPSVLCGVTLGDGVLPASPASHGHPRTAPTPPWKLPVLQGDGLFWRSSRLPFSHQEGPRGAPLQAWRGACVYFIPAPVPPESPGWSQVPLRPANQRKTLLKRRSPRRSATMGKLPSLRTLLSRHSPRLTVGSPYPLWPRKSPK